MGVPAFYRWLVNKYPKIVVDAKEERISRSGQSAAAAVDEDHTSSSSSSSSPNPNGIEFDNLYLDMNAIIHPCFHPESGHDHHLCPPQTFDDVFRNVCEYIDRLFQIVRPRRLLYMAIDGVAPRAKMNQQRSRRFRTSKDCEIAEAEENQLRREFELEGKPVFPKQESQVSDSNIITPGTEFMDELSKALQSHIDLKIITDIGWKNIRVILSDANVPGEGEQKIMSFIRLLHTFPDYDPNTHHCIYGLDADLIMLVLATHEVHFSVLREDVLVQEQRGHLLSGEASTSDAKSSLLSCREPFKRSQLKPYQFLHIWILRQYLELDLKIMDPPENIKIDLERIIDDFIFICFLVGNDFLPHMPSLEIHEGAIDLLMHVYKKEMKKRGGYLVDMQWAGDKNARYIKLKRVETFMLSVGEKEEEIFKKRSEKRERNLRWLLAKSSDLQEEEGECQGHSTSEKSKCSASTDLGMKSFQTPASSNGTNNCTPDNSQMLSNTKELKEKLRSLARDRVDLFKDGSFMVDRVRLGASGWKERYYKEKFSAETKEDVENTRKSIVQKYTEGLCWVLVYYFSGVPSWTWFYPYHYGPFASDMKGLSHVKVKFQKGSPFKPFDQLMGVLPPRSAHALPRPYKALMTNKDSNIHGFYPSDFEIDTDGKRFLWQGICKLPFIDEERLLVETKKLEVELKDHEADRNSFKSDILFVRSSNKLCCRISGSTSHLIEVFAALDLAEANSRTDLKNIVEDGVLCVRFEVPNFSLHIPRPLAGVVFPEQIIYEDDIEETQLWHEYHGGVQPRNRLRIQDFHRRTSNVMKSNSNLLPGGAIHKHAGSGWGGRGGKESSSNSLSARAIHEDVGTGWGGRGGKVYNPASDWNGNSKNCIALPVGRGQKPASPSSSFRMTDRAYEHWQSERIAATSSQGWNRWSEASTMRTSQGHGRGRGRGWSVPNTNAMGWVLREDGTRSSRGERYPSQ